jgi:hypothetical protein
LNRLFEAALDGFVTFFGLWTLVTVALVFAGGSFNALLLLSPLVVAASLWLWRMLRRAPEPQANEESGSAARFPVPYRLVAAAAILALYAGTQQLWLLWALGGAFLALCLLDGPREAEARPVAPAAGRAELVVVVVCLLAALSFTTLVHRYDADDAYYMSVPTAALDQRAQPLLAGDTMHGEPGLPLLGPHYRTVSYELLIAAVSFATGVDHRLHYYLLFPLLLATIWIVACRQTLRLLAPRGAAIGLAVICLVTMVWGDTHHAYGNFGLVRLFQGKAALVTIGAPFTLYYGLRYAAVGGRAAWLRLALAQLTMMGFSASGAVIAPLLAGLVLLGGWRPDAKRTRRFLVGLTASALPVIAAGIVALQVREFGAIVSPLDATGTARAIEMVLGQGPRALLALFGMLAAAALSPRLAGYLLAAFVLLLSPWSGQLISLAEETFAWRVLWAIPFPLILGIGAARAATTMPRAGLVGALIFAAVFAAVPGKTTWSAENKASFRLAAFKVGDGFPAAARAVAVTPAGGSVLAPRRAAMWITGFRNHPRLLAVRQDYLEITVGKVHGPEEAAERRLLMEFVHGKLGADRSREVAAAVERRAIDTVVTHPDLTARGGEAFFAELGRLGYGREQLPNGYIVWTRGR